MEKPTDLKLKEPSDLKSTLKLLAYYRSSMESRRALMIQLFITLATLFVLAIAAQSNSNMPTGVKEILYLWALALILLFAGYLYQNEKANAFVRPRYHGLETLLWRQLVDGEVVEEPVGVILLRSWATTWPLGTLLILAFVMALNTWLL